MAGEINTEVHDEPASCRETADWLSQCQPGVGRVGDVINHERSSSESFWQGTAGDACRQQLTTQGRDADEVEKQVDKVKQALLTFASAIDGVRSSINDARDTATAAQLIVTPTAILPPKPVAHPASPLAPEEHQAFADARDEYGRKQQAFEEARGIVDAARSRQDDAHKALDKAMDDPLAAAKNTKTYAMFVIGHGLGMVKGSYGTAKDLFKQADKWNAAAETIQARAELKTGSLRATGLNAAKAGEELAATATARANAASTFGGKIPEKAGNIISASPGDYIKGSGRLAKFGSKALRGVPFVGTGVSVLSGVGDVALGKDPWEAAQDTTANVAGGAAGGWGGAAIGTLICPGVGTVIGGVIGGIAGSMAATEGVSAARGD